MLTFPIFINWLLIHSCNMTDTGNTLPGKIVVSKLMERECVIYMDSDTPKSSFKLMKGNGVEYSGVDWLNTQDAFIGTEVLDRLNRNQHRSNIVRIDLSGKLIDRIYEAEKGELAWPEYSSWDDKYLIFTTHKNVDPTIYPFEGLTPMLSLAIMDIEQKKVITKIDSIGRSPNFLIEESPWLHSGYQFVYSIDGGTQLKVQGEEKIINPVETSEGVYLYDVVLGERKLLVPGGRSAIASPTSNQIAYEKDNSIRVLDLNTNQEKTIYKHSSKEKLRGKHWTPDGKCIYFAYNYQWGIGDMFNTGEKLIEVSTGKEKPFKKIGHGFEPYTWK
jgi:Tol biopolymer transport system component